MPYLMRRSLLVYVAPNSITGSSTSTLLGSTNLKISVIDGEMSHPGRFNERLSGGEAKLVSLPNTSDESLIAESIASSKADVTFIEPAVANAYLAKNPGKLRLINKEPVADFPGRFCRQIWRG